MTSHISSIDTPDKLVKGLLETCALQLQTKGTKEASIPSTGQVVVVLSQHPLSELEQAASQLDVIAKNTIALPIAVIASYLKDDPNLYENVHMLPAINRTLSAVLISRSNPFLLGTSLSLSITTSKTKKICDTIITSHIASIITSYLSPISNELCIAIGDGLNPKLMRAQILVGFAFSNVILADTLTRQDKRLDEEMSAINDTRALIAKIRSDLSKRDSSKTANLSERKKIIADQKQQLKDLIEKCKKEAKITQQWKEALDEAKKNSVTDLE